jgi:ABC-2 type transport system permease protein
MSSVLVLFFWFIGQGGNPGGNWAERIFHALSLSSYFPSFSRGVIDSNGIIYYLSMVAVFLFLTLRSIESRRWR